MKLYIMTKGRVGNQETLKHIPSNWESRTVLVCPPDEVRQHTAAHPSIQILGEPFLMNYSQKFQWLMYRIHGEGKGVIMDDDLWWDRRPDDGAERLEKVPDKNDLTLMWSTMEKYLDVVPLCGIHPRMMGQAQPLPCKHIGKIITVQGINTSLFPHRDIPKVDYDPILADVHLNCYLLSRGYPNRLITEWVVNWKSSQAPGGCDYRTPEMQTTACERVAEMYPDFVRAVWKKAKKENWLGSEGRTDLRVQWQKMYRHGRANRG